jgi:hypothetical protein
VDASIQPSSAGVRFCPTSFSGERFRQCPLSADVRLRAPVSGPLVYDRSATPHRQQHTMRPLPPLLARLGVAVGLFYAVWHAKFSRPPRTMIAAAALPAATSPTPPRVGPLMHPASAARALDARGPWRNRRNHLATNLMIPADEPILGATR